MSMMEYSSEFTQNSRDFPFSYTVRPFLKVEKEETSITTLQVLFSLILKIVPVQRINNTAAHLLVVILT
jgi:hypothetical protein